MAREGVSIARREAPGRTLDGGLYGFKDGVPGLKRFVPPSKVRSDLVPKGGLEPPRDNSHTPLKRTCLPFHHFGSGKDRQDSRLPDAEL